MTDPTPAHRSPAIRLVVETIMTHPQQEFMINALLHEAVETWERAMAEEMDGPPDPTNPATAYWRNLLESEGIEFTYWRDRLAAAESVLAQFELLAIYRGRLEEQKK